MADDVSGMFQYIRDDLGAFRKEVNERLDKLVTQDAFDAERRRGDELRAALGQDLVEERESRIEADRTEKSERVAAHALIEKRSKQMWAGVQWGVGTLVALAGVIVAFLAIVR